MSQVIRVIALHINLSEMKNRESRAQVQKASTAHHFWYIQKCICVIPLLIWSVHNE